MGGFFILRKNGLPDGEAAMARVAEAAGRIGFRNAVTVAHDDYHIRVYPKIGAPHAIAVNRFDNGDFAFATGMLIYRGMIGAPALEGIYRRFALGPELQNECIGHYGLVVRRDGRLYVLNDDFGGYQVYCDMEQRALSSSFLLLIAALPSVSLSIQGIYEYVFNGIVSGDDTLLREIVRLPIRSAMEMTETGFRRHRWPLQPPVAIAERSLDGHLAAVDGILQGYFETVASIFGNEVSSALSGGYDSRLLLALMRRSGIRPRLYVYGKPDDDDVQIAQVIAAGEALRLDVIDKGDDLGRVEDFAEVVEQNYWANDGYVWSGLFNNGAETAQRQWRVTGGALAVNGGGGEILRNFFYLRPGRYSPRQLLWTFYSQYDPSICTRIFYPERYYRSLEAKIGDLVGEDVELLARPTVEWLYHNFRCRSWDGKVNSDNNRFGYAALPFQETRLTEIASRIPIAIKDHGALEAALIRRIDEKLASYPSAYSHDFASPPPMMRKILDYSTIFRPTAVRRWTFRLKSRLRFGTAAELMDKPYRSAVLPGRLELAERYFVPARVADMEVMSRIMTFEYFARKLGSKLDPAAG